MREWIAQNKYLLILNFICIIGLLTFIGHYAEILIDFGREVYYPEKILEGKILYKNLFNIYGPLAYQFNALLFKIFTSKLSTLYFAGSICSLAIMNGVYLIANKFLTKALSFAIGILTIAIGITTVSIFNYHFPYSWAVLYGLVAFIYSLYFLIKFLEDNKQINLNISALLAGICITSKYDFLPFSLIILFFIVKNKNLKALLYFITVPVFCYGILFLQGMKFSDLFNTLNIIKIMSKTKTLTYFYSNSGIFYHSLAIPTELILFFKSIISIGLISSGYFIKNKPLSILTTLIGCVVSIIIVANDINRVFGFLPMFLLLFTITTFKKLPTQVKFLAIATILACSKVFWVLLLGSYGNFYIPIAVISSLVLVTRFLPTKTQKYFATYVLIVSAILILNNLNSLTQTQYEIKTDKGKIFTRTTLGKSITELIEYINKNTKKQDKIVIAPEGMTINYLTNRQYDDFYNSLLPLYFETFSEKTIVDYYKTNKPKYIILTNHNTKDYYYKYICQDYALGFCEFVQKNYNLENIIDNKYRFIIFKSKEM